MLTLAIESVATHFVHVSHALLRLFCSSTIIAELLMHASKAMWCALSFCWLIGNHFTPFS